MTKTTKRQRKAYRKQLSHHWSLAAACRADSMAFLMGEDTRTMTPSRRRLRLVVSRNDEEAARANGFYLP